MPTSWKRCNDGSTSTWPTPTPWPCRACLAQPRGANPSVPEGPSGPTVLLTTGAVQWLTVVIVDSSIVGLGTALLHRPRRQASPVSVTRTRSPPAPDSPLDSSAGWQRRGVEPVPPAALLPGPLLSAPSFEESWRRGSPKPSRRPRNPVRPGAWPIPEAVRGSAHRPRVQECHRPAAGCWNSCVDNRSCLTQLPRRSSESSDRPSASRASQPIYDPAHGSKYNHRGQGNPAPTNRRSIDQAYDSRSVPTGSTNAGIRPPTRRDRRWQKPLLQQALAGRPRRPSPAASGHPLRPSGRSAASALPGRQQPPRAWSSSTTSHNQALFRLSDARRFRSEQCACAPTSTLSARSTARASIHHRHHHQGQDRIRHYVTDDEPVATSIKLSVRDGLACSRTAPRPGILHRNCPRPDAAASTASCSASPRAISLSFHRATTETVSRLPRGLDQHRPPRCGRHRCPAQGDQDHPADEQ